MHIGPRCPFCRFVMAFRTALRARSWVGLTSHASKRPFLHPKRSHFGPPPRAELPSPPCGRAPRSAAASRPPGAAAPARARSPPCPSRSAACRPRGRQAPPGAVAAAGSRRSPEPRRTWRRPADTPKERRACRGPSSHRRRSLSTGLAKRKLLFRAGASSVLRIARGTHGRHTLWSFEGRRS